MSLRMPVTFAAKTFVTLTLFVVLFQLALAAGAPWGELTMGGAFPGQLPPRMRVAAFASGLLLAAFGAMPHPSDALS